ncbi:MAG: hypothetical protein U1F43_22395 [Myxococcota bacterium]
MARADNEAQSAPATVPAPVPVPEPPSPSKTKAMVGGVEGYDAQAAKLAPGNQPGMAPDKAPGADLKTPAPDAAKTSAPADGKTAEGADAKTDAKAPSQGDSKAEAAAQGVPPEAADGQAEKLSPIREALLKQFQLMEGKGVGDAEFDAVCSKSQWDKMKANEAAATAKAEEDYKAAMATYNDQCAADPNFKKTHPAPKKAYVPIYTTCIDTQAAIARAAWKASGMAVQRVEGKNFDQFAFGGASRTEGKKLGAWVEGKPGGGTPKPGDMLMFEKAGDKIDKAAAEQRSAGWTFEPKVKQLEKQVADLQAAAASANEAKALAAAAKAKDVEAALDKVRADYEAAKAKLQAKLAEGTAALAKKVEGGAKLEFSHVGFFKSATDETKDGAPTGRQIWETFDGGQSGIGASSQGAKSGKRFYDPKTNMIAGEASQGGAMRWLAGWIDVDKMAKP